MRLSASASQMEGRGGSDDDSEVLVDSCGARLQPSVQMDLPRTAMQMGIKGMKVPRPAPHPLNASCVCLAPVAAQA